jgi:hypothetical protein
LADCVTVRCEKKSLFCRILRHPATRGGNGLSQLMLRPSRGSEERERAACPDHRPTLVAVAGTDLTYAVCRSCRGAILRSVTPEGALATFEAGWIAYRPEGPFRVPPAGINNDAGVEEGR